MSTFTIRKMNLADIPVLMELKNQNGWNQLEDDWARFMRINPKGCFVGIQGDKIIGTVTSIPYPGAIGWVGMLLVDENCRGHGFGSSLLQKAIDQLKSSGKTIIKLDATSLGAQLYLNRGFKEESRLTRYLLEGINPSEAMQGNKNLAIHTVKKSELETILSIDRNYLGYDRSVFLKEFMVDNLDFTFILDDHSGYITGRNGYVSHQIGPIIAKSLEIAQELFVHYLREKNIKDVFTDVHARNKRFTRFLESLGGRPHREFIRMYLGRKNVIGRHENEYAISGPEKG